MGPAENRKCLKFAETRRATVVLLDALVLRTVLLAPLLLMALAIKTFASILLGTLFVQPLAGLARNAPLAVILRPGCPQELRHRTWALYSRPCMSRLHD